MQEKLVPAIHHHSEIVANICLLLRLASILNLPVLLTTQYQKGLGATVEPIASLLKGIEPVDKVEFGCFGNEVFRRRLKDRHPHVNTILLMGIESHICVAQTALGALERGYLVHVASDAVGSRTEANWQIGLRRMERAGALLSSTEMMVYELLGQSGTAEFKAILPYLKD
jgi:isochorismate hydrolase